MPAIITGTLAPTIATKSKKKVPAKEKGGDAISITSLNSPADKIISSVIPGTQANSFILFCLLAG